MEKTQLVRISKTLSKHLRHNPQGIGLTLETGGWVSVTALLEAFERKGFSLTRSDLEEVVSGNDKQRFAFDETGTRIRASQGHSVGVDLGLEALEPPAVLFHGTTSAALTSVLETGLQRMRRHHVHLSIDQATAQRVGSRHGTAVILRVAALSMHEAGHAFYRSANGVWLTDSVPPAFMSRPASLEDALERD